uniref:CCHC-type domain-containing protein n=1 Tax=Xenopus tropicalis TaxID=8364 RepID=A0A803JF28_XENTR
MEVVLNRFCEKVEFVGKVLNELGIWTSKFKYKVKFKKGLYPPARFRLGNINLDVFFPEMPVFCKKCRSYGHTAENCNLCSNCGEDTHMTKNCVLQKRCNLCFQMGHLYAGCPQREKVESQKSIHEDLSASPNFEVFADPVLSFVLQDKTTEEKREEKENLPDVEMESELGQVGKVLEFLSDFDLSASPNLQILEENLSEPLSPVSEEGHFHVTGEESPAGKMLQEGLTVKRKTGFESLSRGEKLYRSYKGKSIQELKEVVSDWSDEEEYGKLGKYFEEIPNKKEARKKIL